MHFLFPLVFLMGSNKNKFGVRMGDEDKKNVKREPGVADIVPVRADGTRPREKDLPPMNLPIPKNALPPKQLDGTELAQNQGKKKSAIS
jgi:hypothetical protein